MDSKTALEALEAVRRKHDNYGAMDTEGREAIYVIEEAAEAGKPFPFKPRATDDPITKYLKFNPFQLYQSVPGWEVASAELVEAARAYWTALIEERLGVTIA